MSELDALRGMVFQVAGHTGRTFTEPDDDWSALLIIEGRGAFEVVSAPPELVNSHEGMDALIEGYVERIRRAGGERLALLVSAWMVTNAKGLDPLTEELALERRLGQHPARVEVLLAELVGRVDFELWQAPITRRRSKPPVLGGWKRFEVDGFTGRLVEPLVQAIRPQG